MNNPLLTTLSLIENLSRYDANADTLSRQLSVSVATFKRHLVEARLFGAEIVSVSLGGNGWVYELRNWPAIKVRTTRWIDLEKSRSLL